MQTGQEAKTPPKSNWRWIKGAVFAVIGVGLLWISFAPESGVKVGNEMDQYALDYLSEHGLLEAGEEVRAYYDVTMSMDGTEAAILTNKRVIYHKDGRTSAIPLRDIDDVRHRNETMTGDIFEVESASGEVMKIEVAPLNGGETFKNVLMSLWKKAKREKGDG